MKQAISQESVSDPGHSCSPEGQSNANRAKSAAMLGIALSVGASGALVSQTEAAAAVSTPTVSDTTKAFSSDSKGSASSAQETIEAAQTEIIAYHTVESGESLWQIAQQHRVGLRDLKVANELPPETSIRVGQVLKVPGAVESTPGELSFEVTESVSTEPTLMAQSVAQSQTETVVAEASEAADLVIPTAVEDEAPVVASSSEPTEQPATLEIEIADASLQIEAAQTEKAPVVAAAYSSPQAFDSYQIQAGDTIASIASSLGTTTQELISANGLANPDFIVTGTTLRVPEATPNVMARRSSEGASVETASVGGPRPASERLAYLQSTASRPDAASLLGEMRSATPAEAYTVGSQEAASAEASQSIDPYVANLLDEVESARETSIEVSEAAPESIESISSSSPLLARAEQRRGNELGSEDIALVTEAGTADPELLAAAPLSPDAYIPAQRPSAGQVVSPDMPILPSSEEFLPEAPEYFDGYIWPTQGTFTSGYGWRWGRMHRGVDVAGPVGTPIVAAAMGVVEEAGWNSGGYGNLVEIRHPDGSMTLYAHNNSLSVSKGQTVRQGQKIAEMGSTGYSTGPHLHFEIHPSGGGAVNPVAYLPRR
ncbi:MAG: peptidoglycan DD-metalloendopeptidase family protein [Cyanobacteria bacterium P01_C01_bin.69]